MTNQFTATVTTTVIERRNVRAVALVEKHLADRSANTIKARVCATGRNVFEVKGSTGDTHIVTLKECGAPVTTCDCRGWRNYGYCQHVDSVRTLMNVDAPLGGGEWQPAGGWSSQQKRKRVEWQEDV